MKTIFNFQTLLILLTACAFQSCGAGGKDPQEIKNITAFSIMGIDGMIGANTISLTVPYGTDLTSLTPTISTWWAATVSPASGTAQDFTYPVEYMVTAADGSTKTYTVTVTAAAISAEDITVFSIMGIDGAIRADTISLTVPYGTDLTSLTPTITITGASVTPASGTAQDFTYPVEYMVTAADGSTKTYTVTVAEAPSSDKDIAAFSIMGIDGSIGADAISLTVPYETGRPCS